jgi:hypothetical protein
MTVVHNGRTIGWRLDGRVEPGHDDKKKMSDHSRRQREDEAERQNEDSISYGVLIPNDRQCFGASSGINVATHHLTLRTQQRLYQTPPLAVGSQIAGNHRNRCFCMTLPL